MSIMEYVYLQIKRFLTKNMSLINNTHIVIHINLNFKGFFMCIKDE